MKLWSEDVKKHFTMPRRAIAALMAVSICLLSTPSQAKWTRWYNINSSQEWGKLAALLDKNNYRTYAKQVQCKGDNKGFWVRIDYRPTYASGWYYFRIDSKNKLDAEFQRYRKRGAIIISRSDVKTARGVVSCAVWRKPF